MASDQDWFSGAHWRSSSYSSGGGECLEVAEAFPGAARWRKSSYSNTSGGNCVEVADDLVGLVPVRDSKVPDGPVVTVSARAWAPFVAAVRAGRR
ncbi:DUF397 domain-containing protein [Streptomyces sp. CC77]|uniref:DUF397 domain-containing protein n=1 Tax=Streptomyces sp. CC77 TaxID=1906739 RepID=UPI0008DD7859|nr:DUF397 domain-containing protein [Streptomyces sp. CC77]OII69896.1 DUF397 domain-containing protein [Streptomyces sp. CC77]